MGRLQKISELVIFLKKYGYWELGEFSITKYIINIALNVYILHYKTIYFDNSKSISILTYTKLYYIYHTVLQIIIKRYIIQQTLYSFI